MARTSFVAALLLAALALAQSFTITPSSAVRPAVPRLSMSMEDMPGLPTLERGVSVDQDGKSNVWAIEPKMEVSSKSSDENGKTLVVAGGGLAALGVFAALILSNLPDPSQF